MDLYVPQNYAPPMEEVQAKEIQCCREDQANTVETPTPVRRPQRDAARRAIRRIADWAKDISAPPPPPLPPDDAK